MNQQNKALADELREVVYMPREALTICRKRRFVFDKRGGRWEKLAFTFYCLMVERAQSAERILNETPAT